MTQGDIGEAARETYRAAGMPPDTPAKMLDLARCVLGPDSVQTVPRHALPADGCLATIFGRPRIFLRAGLSHERRRFLIGHELGHHVLGLDSSCLANEDMCDAFAAALIAPDGALELALPDAGSGYRRLASWFVATESCIALRLGEFTGRPIALVTSRRVRVRGEPFGWPSDSEIRVLAGRNRIPGLRKARLRDDATRVVLTAP